MIYEYYCENCRKEFEIEVSIREHRREAPCPKCEEMCIQVISQTSFLLNGSGWAKDRYS